MSNDSTAWNEGYEAFKRGVSINTDPYPVASGNSRKWMTGWSDACDEAYANAPQHDDLPFDGDEGIPF